ETHFSSFSSGRAYLRALAETPSRLSRRAFSVSTSFQEASRVRARSGPNMKRSLRLYDLVGFDYVLSNAAVARVETNSGSIVPASFERKSRCPDEFVRRIRVTACFEDPNWTGKLLETYDAETDCFVIAPCAWTIWQSRLALTHQYLSASEILLTCSSSPSAEGPDFVDSIKR
ncbi:N-terminal asparagine amidohydrolase family protein, partial [Dorcoceras hygrometricum]